MKAPSEVDTLRDESCPVCGETDAWDGDTCKVCGFVSPPDKFQDPDVDMHKQLDLRNNSDLDGSDVNDLNADINDRDGDGLDDNTGEPITDEDALGADDAQPMLVCPNCGFEVAGGEPKSIDTAQPDPALEAADSAAGPAAGDLCPNCGQAPLASPNEMAQAGEPVGEDEGAPPAEDGDPDEVERGPREEDEPDDPEDDEHDLPFEPDRDEDSDDERDEEDDEDEPAKKGFPPRKK